MCRSSSGDYAAFVSEEPSVRKIILRLIRKNRWELGGFLAAFVLGVIGARLGESYSLWWYLLAAPLAVLALVQIPSSTAESKARRVERARVQAIAVQRGRSRHVRRKEG